MWEWELHEIQHREKPSPTPGEPQPHAVLGAGSPPGWSSSAERPSGAQGECWAKKTKSSLSRSSG